MPAFLPLLGGKVAWLRRLRLTVAVILSIPFSLGHPTGVAAASILEDPRYLLSTTTPSLANVQHDVSFILPAGSNQVTPNDFIQVILPDFTNLFPFTDVINARGTPIFSVSGNRLLVRGIVALPGTRIGLSGARGTNPAPGGSFAATIQVTKGGVSGIVSHEAIVEAGANGNYVTTTAFVSSPLSSLYISGHTAAGAFVTLTRDNVAVGTNSAGSTGEFSFSISGLDPGDYTFQIVSSDGNSLLSSPQTVSTYLTSGGITSITGLLLSPTITEDKDTINRGDTITFSGSARPLSLISIFSESPLRTYEVTADSAGLWQFTLSPTETNSYQPGEYRVRAVAQDTIGNRSIDSQTITFTVLAPVVDTSNPPPSCDISKGDLNCDTRVNLTDFSILLANWRTNKRRADINADGIVNLVDFSIMMSNFQRR